MANTGVCCASLEEPKALMKMGLSMVLVGHINFLLGALVHGAVLRHINLHKQARVMEYAISNIIALVAGLVGVVVGIVAIVLSKNKKSRVLTWSLFVLSAVAGLVAAASAIGLTVSVARTIARGGRSLLTHCRFPDAIGYSSVTNECPFDPTRIYSTTIILWVPLIVMSVVQAVFSARCFAVCVAFLGLPCCPRKRRPRDLGRPVKTLSAPDVPHPPRYAPKPEPEQRHRQGDDDESPPEQHELLARPSPLYRSYQPPQSSQFNSAYRSYQPPQSSQFNRASLARSSFWI